MNVFVFMHLMSDYNEDKLSLR